jgi:hypothetical protein
MLADTLDTAAAQTPAPAVPAGAAVPVDSAAVPMDSAAALTAAATSGTLPPPEAIPPGYALVPVSALTGVAAAPAAVPAPAVPSVPSSAPPSVVPPPSAQAAARVALALRELGVAEQPPGSNDGARIAEYRTVTARAGVGPWCAYFTSWVGAQAGTPLGAAGQGEGYVPTMANWLRDSGRYVTPTEGTPRPGDLVFFDWEGDGELDHIGLVESVTADGRVHTIEGNADGAVRQRDYAASQIAGYGLLP